jgi:hypothetical protein
MSPANRGPSSVSERLPEIGVHRCGVERPCGTQRPQESPAPLGETQTSDVGMQPRTPAGTPTSWVRDQGPVHHHHTQQSGSRRLGPATHARPDWLGGPLTAAASNFVRAGVDRPPTAGHHDSSASRQRAENRHWGPVTRCVGHEPPETPLGPHHFGCRSSNRSAGQPT